MNIFVLSKNPIEAAQYQCNKHVVKLLVESVQLLCNCFDQSEVPYKRTHYNHPCSIWTRSSLDNYNWLKVHAWALCDEYTLRYKKRHKCEGVIRNLKTPKLESKGLNEFAQAMPEIYRNTNVVSAYRDYYCSEKLRICKWMTESQIPEFVKHFLINNSKDTKEFIR